MAILCSTNLIHDLVAKVVLCLGHIKIKSNQTQVALAREEENRDMLFTVLQGGGG